MRRQEAKAYSVTPLAKSVFYSLFLSCYVDPFFNVDIEVCKGST